jgi:transposase
MKKLTLAPHFTTEQLEDLYRNTKNANESRRWQIVWLFSKGKDAYQIEEVTGITHRRIRVLINSYNKFGLDFAYDGHDYHEAGPPPKLTEDEKILLFHAIENEEPPTGGLWTGAKVCIWIQNKLQKTCSLQTAYKYMKLRFSLQTPRPQNINCATKDEQEEWKKNSSNTK